MITTVVVEYGPVAMETKQYEGETLRYLAVEPDGYLPDRRYPMVILLHGFGSHMGDIAGLSPAIDADGYVYACPNAPMPLSLEYGGIGFAWTAVGEEGGDSAGLSAEEKLAAFVQEAMDQYHVRAGQAVLGGFSQGGMMTYRLGLTKPDLFRGITVLSGRVPDPKRLLTRLPDSRGQAIFITHGTADTLIPVEEGRQARRLLEAKGYAPEYREYEMAHEVTQEVIADLSRWIRSVLPPADEPA